MRQIKRGSADWTVGKLMGIILLAVLIVLILITVPRALQSKGNEVGTYADSVILFLNTSHFSNGDLEDCISRPITDAVGGDVLVTRMGDEFSDATFTACTSGVCRLSKDETNYSLWVQNLGSLVLDSFVTPSNAVVLYSPGLTKQQLYGPVSKKEIYQRTATSARQADFEKNHSLEVDRIWGEYVNSEQYKLHESPELAKKHWEIYNAWVGLITSKEKELFTLPVDTTQFIKFYGDGSGGEYAVWHGYWDNGEYFEKWNVWVGGEVRKRFETSGHGNHLDDVDALDEFYSMVDNFGPFDDTVYYEIGNSNSFSSWRNWGTIDSFPFYDGDEAIDTEKELNSLKGAFQQMKLKQLETFQFSQKNFEALKTLFSGKTITLEDTTYVVDVEKENPLILFTFRSDDELFGLRPIINSQDSSILSFTLLQKIGGEFIEVGNREDYVRNERSFNTVYSISSAYDFLKENCGR